MQSVLAIPFVIPPVPEPAAEVAPSEDGAFLMSFRDAAADQVRADEAGADATGMASLAVRAFPLVLAPGHAGQDPGSALAEMAGAMGSQAQALVPEGVPAGTVWGAADSGTTVGEAASVVWKTVLEGTPGLGPSPSWHGADRAVDAGASASAGPAGLTASGAGASGAAPPTKTAAGRNVDPNPAEAGVVGAAIPSPTAPLEETAGTGLPKSEAGSAAKGLIAGRIMPGTDLVATTDRAGHPQSPVAEGAALPSTSPYPLPAGAELSAELAVESDSGNASGQPLRPDSAIIAGIGGTAAAKEIGGVEKAVPAGLGSEARDATEAPVNPPAPTAPPGVEVGGPKPQNPAGVVADAQDIDLPVALSPDPPPDPGAAAGADPGPVDRLKLEPAANAASFWERLLTGLSVALPGVQAPPASGRALDVQRIRDIGPEGYQATAAPVSDPHSPSVAPDQVASGLAIFAKAQGPLTTPAAEASDTREPTDLPLAALSALPGALVQGLASPPPASAGPTHPPVPQVAAQITAALSQSADGAVELALSPEELGKVRLRLERDARHPDRMVVHITFERPETLDLFRRHAGELADALREAGYAGADIGFGQQDSGAGTPDRNPAAAPRDYGPAATGLAEARATDPSPLRLMAGASLDLRL